MEAARPSVFTTSNAEGVERVLKGKRGYAFVMESTSIEYQVERHCDLQQIGGLLDSKGYGIAMPVSKYLLNRCIGIYKNRYLGISESPPVSWGLKISTYCFMIFDCFWYNESNETAGYFFVLKYRPVFLERQKLVG